MLNVTQPDDAAELLQSFKAAMRQQPLPAYDLQQLYADPRIRGFVATLIAKGPRAPRHA